MFLLLEIFPHELMHNCMKPDRYVNQKHMDMFCWNVYKHVNTSETL